MTLQKKSEADGIMSRNVSRVWTVMLLPPIPAKVNIRQRKQD